MCIRDSIETATSSKDGKVPIISDLPLSMYKLKETKAPIGYVSTNFEEQIDAHYQGPVSYTHLWEHMKNSTFNVQKYLTM